MHYTGSRATIKNAEIIQAEKKKWALSTSIDGNTERNA